MARNGRIGTNRRTIMNSVLLTSMLMSLVSTSLAYRPGDIVPMSKMGQYHSSRTVWHDMIGRHCPIFAVNREALIPIPKPIGYTGADPSFQVGKEKFFIPWLFVINRKSSEVPMIDVHLRYSGSDLLGVTGKVVDMPHRYVEIHPDIHKQFWDPQHWPKHVLVRYTWEEQSEIDVASGFYVLFGSGLLMTFILSIYILQSSRDKFARLLQKAVCLPGEWQRLNDELYEVSKHHLYVQVQQR
ncbi:hypothetical protein HYC85_006411 [Camellia sinensis]|uniref:Uncharacterized protein n=1 Tax=Camellia sinensis TaxID=4442 RepID=A0A7J7HLW3_CAMSI|nr:hypothetical protein HYC85_006411 [Camellia sinensis]